MNRIFISNPLFKEINNLKNEVKGRIEEQNKEINNWNKLINKKNEEKNKEIPLKISIFTSR